MIGWKNRNGGGAQDDMELRAFLKKNDPVAMPSPAALSMLETRIMAGIDAIYNPAISADMSLPVWNLSREWALRSAAAGILFVMLGFAVGREFDNLFSQTSDPSEVYASAGETPWQSFIAAPSPPGETDDAAE